MARTEVRVEGLDTLIRAAARVDARAARDVLDQLVRSAQPTVADAQSRMRALGGVGPMVAGTIRLDVDAKGVSFRLGGPGHPYSLGREFGAKRTATRRMAWRNQFGKGITFRAAKRIPYSRPSIFGSFTGNQFDTVGGKVSGRAFYPAVAAGMARTTRDMQAVVDHWVASLAQAGKLGD